MLMAAKRAFFALEDGVEGDRTKKSESSDVQESILLKEEETWVLGMEQRDGWSGAGEEGRKVENAEDEEQQRPEER